MPKGRIIRLVKAHSFGFIKTEQGEDLFFHRSQLQGVDYNSLIEGQQVEFEAGQGHDGSCAVKVRLTQHEGEQHQAHLHPLREDTKINYGRKN